MTTVAEIYQGAERLINELLRKEMSAQGHYLTGAMQESLSSSVEKKGKADLMEGFAAYYSQILNDGYPSNRASFKQAPFLIKYFQARGLEEKEATAAAFATIKTWMKEGMPTQGSSQYSSTGNRTKMIDNALGSPSIDEYMTDSLDFIVEEAFQQEKSEVI